ncbi:DNA polymerase III subunit psi [Pantoea sp. 1.19]|uniref:DNA polymerase III subunit psi n=1 Tax=Pantoea sp. 1.19 TaxID=1925589 RepID=UPI000948E8D3|nr:DNA polymerase III subunit psi [Pantoea sp. 1.19]
MTSGRDERLRQMGIVQYQLRRPGALRGEVAIALPAGVRLVIVADPLPDGADALLDDVLRSLDLTRSQVGMVTPQQWALLAASAPCPCWQLGGEAQGDALLSTPALAELHHSPAARRALWQQICHHEFDSLTHRG